MDQSDQFLFKGKRWFTCEQIGRFLTRHKMKPAIAYYRASTKRQGQSGLGIDAQQKSVEEFAYANGYQLLGKYTEVKTGKRNERCILKTALAECQKKQATLLIAKLDRLSRRVSFIATLMESKVAFKVVDLPDADEFTLHILAAVAEKERKDISLRTKLALAAAKRRGRPLGIFGKKVLSVRNKNLADDFACTMQPVITALQLKGIRTLRAMVVELNRLEIPTYYKSGHRWHLSSLHNLMSRLRKI